MAHTAYPPSPGQDPFHGTRRDIGDIPQQRLPSQAHLPALLLTPAAAPMVSFTQPPEASAALDFPGDANLAPTKNSATSLCQRIEALQVKNQRLRSHHESILQSVAVGHRSQRRHGGRPGSHLGTPRGSSSPIGGGTPRSSTAPLGTSNAVVAALRGNSQHTATRPKLKVRTESLARKLKDFRDLIRQYSCQEPQQACYTPPTSLQPQNAQVQEVLQARQQAEVALLQHQQTQLELERQRIAAQQLEQLAATEQQAAAAQAAAAQAASVQRAAAEQMVAENRRQMQELEAAAAMQQQHHQQQVLELETALLEQSALRERELQAQLRDLDEQFEEVEEADSRIKLRAAEVAELASARAIDAERRLLVVPSAGSPPPGTGSTWQGPPATPAFPAVMSAPTPAMVSPLGHGSPPPQLPSTASSSQSQLGLLGHGPGFARHGLQVPLGLPRVYEAAVTIILQHGWHVLHGGENAGPAWTALHWAASEGRADVCELLLRARADAGHRDELGKTALDYALENGQRAAAAILSALPEPEALPHGGWNPSFNHQVFPIEQSRASAVREALEAESESGSGAQLVAALAAQGTWPRDEQRV